MDMGSTNSRLSLHSDSGNDITIESGVVLSGRYSSDFSSSCFPFDDGDPYIGNHPDTSRIATSIKPAILLLCDLEPATLRSLVLEYPHGEILLRKKYTKDRKDKRVFEKRIEEALRLFFDVLRDRTVAACKDENLQVTSVGIALPGHWPKEVENFLTKFSLETFLKGHSHIKVHSSGIHYHSETQALGHYIFKHRVQALKSYGSNKSTLLLADFGGQNLVSNGATR